MTNLPFLSLILFLYFLIWGFFLFKLDFTEEWEDHSSFSSILRSIVYVSFYGKIDVKKKLNKWWLNDKNSWCLLMSAKTREISQLNSQQEKFDGMPFRCLFFWKGGFSQQERRNKLNLRENRKMKKDHDQYIILTSGKSFKEIINIIETWISIFF